MSFLGGKTPQVQTPPIGMNAGGITSSFNGMTPVITADPSRTAAVGNITNSYSALSNEIGGQRSLVAPGMNDLLQSQLGSINNSARSAVGNLQQNLQSRRILGSSFGQDTLTRAQAEFSKQRADVTAQNFLQSLDATNKLIQQQYDAQTKAAQTGLNEMNFEAGLGAQVQSQTAQILAANAQANAKLQAESQAGAGKALGGLIGPASTMLQQVPWGSIASGIGGLMGAGGAAGAGAAEGSEAAAAMTAMMML